MVFAALLLSFGRNPAQEKAFISVSNFWFCSYAKLWVVGCNDGFFNSVRFYLG